MELLHPDVSTGSASLAEKLENRTAKVCIVGLGYVGVPLAVEFAKAGFNVIGIDVSNSKVAALNGGRSCTQDVRHSIIAELVASHRLRATDNFSVIAQCDTVNICVPTPSD
jgi:UDP-N-acetyl-D-glucosamine dehydrogenase